MLELFFLEIAGGFPGHRRTDHDDICRGGCRLHDNEDNLREI